MNDSPLQTVAADMDLDVQRRLSQLETWRAAWREEDEALLAHLEMLEPGRWLDLQRGVQIAGLRRRLTLQLVQQPLELSAEAVHLVGFPALRQHLTVQFAGLTQAQRLLWLNNFLFILTPDLRRLSDKIVRVRAHHALGQQRNFLLGGPSGMGKSTYLNWLALNERPVVETERNRVPVIKIDAPVSNRTPKPLFQRILMECGATYTATDNEEVLLMKLILFLQRCRSELLIVDEVEHITSPDLRRRVLEISNLTHGLPIVCASCHPLRWIEGDAEVRGRWNDYFELRQYTGQRLQRLLAFLELLLPFTGDAFLADHTLFPASKEGRQTDGPARLIEQWTGGILRDIMLLMLEASARAIRRNMPHLTPLLLEETWRDIQTSQVTDFLAVLRRNGGME